MTDDLTAFVSARLDEDEATAKAAIESHPRGKGEWSASGDAYGASVQGADDENIVYNEGTPSLQEAGHIARHDPASVLREVEAKRAIMAGHARVESCFAECGTCHESEEGWAVTVPVQWPCKTVRLLAAVYSGHPGYREEWRPR